MSTHDRGGDMDVITVDSDVLDTIDVVAIAREVAEEWVANRRCSCHAETGSIPVDTRTWYEIEVDLGSYEVAAP